VRGRVRRWAPPIALAAILAGCAGGGEPPARAWLTITVEPAGDATATWTGERTPSRPADVAAEVLGLTGGTGSQVRFIGVVTPGTAPELAVDASAVPADDAVEVCLPAVDVQVRPMTGPPPVHQSGCWTSLRGQRVVFTLHPEGWALPAASALAVMVAVLARAGRRRPWASWAALALSGIAVVVVGDAAVEATVAGLAPATADGVWLAVRLTFAAGSLFAVWNLVHRARAREREPMHATP
jgi:hypothetical protein